MHEHVHPLSTDAVLRNSTCWWRGRSVEKPPDHSVYLGQTAVCDLSKHDKEQGKLCEKQRGWRRERQTVVRKPWGEWCGFTAGHSDYVRTSISPWNWGRKGKGHRFDPNIQLVYRSRSLWTDFTYKLSTMWKLSCLFQSSIQASLMKLYAMMSWWKYVAKVIYINRANIHIIHLIKKVVICLTWNDN